MSYFGSWDQSSGWYEQPRVVNDMNDKESHERKPQDGMNCIG